MTLSKMPLAAVLAAVFALAACSTPEGPAVKLGKADVLPLALDDDFEFRKIQQSLFDPAFIEPATRNEPINFERARRTWGAVGEIELRQRHGNYYNVFWKSRKAADITMRLEYRQAGLGNHVMAQERHYSQARGNFKSSFEVVGDEFLENGRVTAWRLLMVVDGRIVALSQSYMWR
jgi:hypothetical protein